MTIAQVFDRLTSRVRQRRETAQERIESAAIALSADQSIDVAGVEDALRDAGLTVDQFRERVEFHARRREHRDRFERLATSRNRVEKIEKQITAEEAKHSEIIDAFRKRIGGMMAEAAEAGRDVSSATASRDWLLHPDNAPLPVVDNYREALDQEQDARVALETAEREVRELRQEIKSEEGWLQQIAGDDSRTIHPPAMVVTVKQREKLTGQAAQKYDEHSQRKTRLERRLVEAEKTVADARSTLATAEAAVAALQKTILAT
jgi:hypothetical protein